MNIAPLIALADWLARLFARRHAIKAQVLPLIEEAATKYPTLDSNAERREWVVQTLIRNGLTESSARLMTEAGVALWKRIQAKKAKKAAKAAAKAAARS